MCSEAVSTERKQASETLLPGWVNASFRFQATDSLIKQFTVQMNRYGSTARLNAAFDHLLTLEHEVYKRVPAAGIGEAAVIYCDEGGMNTLWFRRGDFIVWISPFTQNAVGEGNEHARKLAEVIDARLLKYYEDFQSSGRVRTEDAEN